MSVVKKFFKGLDILEVTMKKKVKKRNPSILRRVMDQPEDFKLIATIEGEEIVIKIRQKD